ncbi:MAG: helix-turn-helix transcriptional regulator [Clostridia bacterium]|nr:helix-turn-helix transcriptional regulator [Clostridia bacterium]
MDKQFYNEYKMIGLNIAFYRRLKNYTQEALAEKVDIDQTHLSKIERAAVGVSLDLLFKIADVLEVDIYKFFIFKA